MRHLISAAYFFSAYAGLPLLVRAIQRRRCGVFPRVLFAHRVIDFTQPLFTFYMGLDFLTVMDFRRRLEYLRKNFKIISIDEYARYVQTGEAPQSNTIVLTFDDGYRCFYTSIFPLLKKYNISATMFLCTECLEKGAILLHDRLGYILATSSETKFSLPELDSRIFSLGSEEERALVFREVGAKIHLMCHDEKVRTVDRLSEVLKVDESAIPRHIPMLSWSEVREMQDSGLVTFGAHTVSHAILTSIGIREARDEILQSKQVMEKELDVPVRFMAYPNGADDDFNESVKEAVQEAGYDLAFTTISRFGGQIDPYELPRDGFSSSEPFSRFKLRVSGFFDFCRPPLTGKLWRAR
jgi:peptidoglycan/xylan/chitin deacetylase (PgdA/CDA1 family)